MIRATVLILLFALAVMTGMGDRAAAQRMQPDRAANLYVNPQPVQITGYGGSAMEPFISPDGQFLFFNNEDDASHNKAIHFAQRTGLLSFRYLGELPGVNAHVPETVDAAPSMDTQGNFYFTSTRNYKTRLRSVFAGVFDGRRVTDVHVVEGGINDGLRDGILNMDMGISPDGDTLYISRARFGLTSLITHAPVGSQLLIARRQGDRFVMDPNGRQITANLHTDSEYAPAVSDDGLELYFNRGPRIMVATRASVGEPFGKPSELRALSGFGFVEAPTISLDKQELFFHAKVGDVCCAIYRMTRAF